MKQYIQLVSVSPITGAAVAFGRFELVVNNQSQPMDIATEGSHIDRALVELELMRKGEYVDTIERCIGLTTVEVIITAK